VSFSSSEESLACGQYTGRVLEDAIVFDFGFGDFFQRRFLLATFFLAIKRAVAFL
jgi:hypothetical protein